MLDLHHIPNIKDAKRLIKNFTTKKGVALSIPSYEHINIRAIDCSLIKHARTLLSIEIKNLRKNTQIPITVLIKVIEANKILYPQSFKKSL